MMGDINVTLTERFSYDSLRREERELRLVRFSNCSTPTAVDLVLKSTSWNSLPAFNAVSYLWGDPASTRTVRVNGRLLPVTEHLHQVLLRLHQEGGEREWFWIDAICIDQNNSEEKSWQVVQMGDVYGQAALVYIWLGPSSDDSDAVLEMMRRIGPEAHKAGVTDLWFEWTSLGDRIMIPDQLIERAHNFLAQALDDEDLRSPRLLAAVASLLRRANWYRIWVVQEIGLARDGLVLCGAEGVSLDAFDAALSTIFFCKNSDFTRAQPQWRDFGNILNNNLFQLRGLISRRQRRRDLKAGLLAFLLSEFMAPPGRPFYLASDPRDNIFGLLGIAADTKLLGLRPDYSCTAAEVYTTATRAIVKCCPEYSLDFCNFPKEIHDLPSWVPDWQRIGRVGFHPVPLSDYNHFKSSGDWKQPPPGGSPPAFPDGVPSWRVLRQKGCSVDIVEAVVPDDGDFTGTDPSPTLSHTLKAPGAERTRMLELILEFVTNAHLAIDGARVDAVLWRTLVAEYPGVLGGTPDFDTLADHAFRQQPVSAATLTEAQRTSVLRNLYPFPRHADSITELQAAVDEFLKMIWLYASVQTRGRKLFVTVGGKLGLGPENMQRHDVVTILLGTSVPIVLRPFKDHFTFVGGAYVHGIMDGEFMRGDPQMKDFDIA
ncbi:hypothetical protein ACHAQA_006668 [Verticillium albo-atrum]